VTEISAAEFRRRFGIADDAPVEVSAEEFRAQFAGGSKRRHSSEADTEPKPKRDFAEWLAVASPHPVLTEQRVVPGRRFRADWWIAELKISIEYDGVADHATKRGAWRDAEKGNLTQLEGILFLRVNSKSINDGSAFVIVERAIRERMEASDAQAG
jgi:hypothetical protein